MDNLFARLENEAAVIAAAPYSFVVAALIVGAIAWVALRWQFQGRIDNQAESITLLERKVADYKDKLDGDTPDEAHARIEALEKAVRGRRLAPEQFSAIARVGKHPGGDVVGLNIRSIHTCSDGRRFGLDLKRAFEAAGGWRVSAHSTLDEFPVRGGLAVLVADPDNLRREEQTVVAALNAADLGFELVGFQAGSIMIVIADPEINPDDLRELT